MQEHLHGTQKEMKKRKKKEKMRNEREREIEIEKKNCSGTRRRMRSTEEKGQM